MRVVSVEERSVNIHAYNSARQTKLKNAPIVSFTTTTARFPAYNQTKLINVTDDNTRYMRKKNFVVTFHGNILMVL